VEKDVFQLLHAKKDAKRDQPTNHCMNASGKLIHQNARNLKLELIQRKNAMTHARTQPLLNVTLRIINALNVK